MHEAGKLGVDPLLKLHVESHVVDNEHNNRQQSDWHTNYSCIKGIHYKHCNEERDDGQTNACHRKNGTIEDSRDTNDEVEEVFEFWRHNVENERVERHQGHNSQRDTGARNDHDRVSL